MISIKFVDKMGDDFRVFEAAKATLGGEEESGFVRGETDHSRLINFLAREKHITPFCHPHVTFECEAPIAIALDSYAKLVEAGLAPEQARFVLPQGMITRWIWTGSLYGWYEVWRQRSSEHAQYEARLFASQLDTHMLSLFPIAWEALKVNK